MSGITNMAKKAGAALAGAFAVKKLVEFGKECLDLGSDIQEVQNVVDVSFPNLSAKVNEFAKNAAASFGLSETMAKKFAGTFGAMASAFGFTEKESYEMSAALTGLAGDVASFYNMSQDEAYTKLKSVFTGETETLKDLGVVMTQSALDSYALANGFGKVTAKMTEQEKVALRYKFVTDQLVKSSGDFVRTSDSWANQTRILSLQFDSLKASIGQGLINVLTPIIKVINALLQKLSVLGSKFAELTGRVFGNQDTSEAAESVDGIAASADNASDSVKGIGDSAKKSAKEAKLSAMAFDKFNKLSKSSSDSGSSKKTAGGVSKAGSSAPASQTKGSGGALDALKKKLKEVGALFSKGFMLGAGNLPDAFKSIKKHLKNIGSSLKDIFTDKNVKAAFTKLAALFIVNQGKVTGSVASIGATLADNLLGGIDLFLRNNKQRIKEWIISMFDLYGEIDTIRANMWEALADIFTVFREYDSKRLTADLITIFTSAFMGTTELLLNIGRDILNLITQPIIENKDKIKEALEKTIKPISNMVHWIAEAVQETWDKIQSVYDEHVKPLFDSLAEGISGWMSTFLDGYNEYIAPVITSLTSTFVVALDEKIKPAIESVLDAFGKFCDVVKDLWEKWLQPFVDWCIENIIPVFAKVFEDAGQHIIHIIGSICDVIKGIGEAFSGLCTILQGIVNGDWKKVWTGLKEFVKGIWNAIVGIFSTAWNAIKLTFSPAITFFKEVWKGVKNAFSEVGAFFKRIFTGAWNAIKTAFSLDGAKRFFGNVWSAVKETFSNVSDWFEKVFSAAWQKVKDVFSTGGKVFSGIKEGIAGVFKTVVNTLITGINKVIAIPFEKINGMLNMIRDVGIAGIKPFSGLWEKNPMPVPQIPRLAGGGYVKKNTPQLALIGDNRHQGEVVSPEGKLLDMAKQAAEMAGGVNVNGRIIELLCKIISILERLDLTAYMDGKKMTKEFVRNINEQTRRTGKLEIEIR